MAAEKTDNFWDAQRAFVEAKTLADIYKARERQFSQTRVSRPSLLLKLMRENELQTTIGANRVKKHIFNLFVSPLPEGWQLSDYVQSHVQEHRPQIEDSVASQDVTVPSEHNLESLTQAVISLAEAVRQSNSNISQSKLYAIIMLLLAVLGGLASIKSIATGSENVSKQEVEHLKMQLIDSLQTVMDKYKDSYIVARRCSVFMLPRRNTLRKTVLSEGEQVAVIQKKHTWVYIQVRDSVHGWVPKKYLKLIK
jgi:hypothetical protein